MSTIKNILVLDDQEEIASLLADTLKEKGHTVSFFTAVDDAKEFFKKNSSSIDLIITDYHLSPKVTGLEFMRFCHQESAIKYILISGNMDQVNDSYCEHEIARVAKPFNNESILSLVKAT